MEDGQRRKALLEFAERENRCVPDSGEQAMLRTMLLDAVVMEFPFAVAAEWCFVPPYTNLGKGDLVFADRANVEYMTPHQSQPGTAPCKVLIVELKFLGSRPGKNQCTKRTEKRRKVEKQLTKAMDQWHRQHPNDEVHGIALEDPPFLHGRYTTLPLYPDLHQPLPLFVVSIPLPPRPQVPDPRGGAEAAADGGINSDDDDDDGDLPPPPSSLGIELVPRAMWGKHYQPEIDSHLWRAVRDYELQKCGHQCQCCQVRETADRPLVLHQKWSIREETKVMLFTGFEILCWLCHDVKHMGWSGVEGRRDATLAHWEKTSHLTREQMNTRIVDAFDTYDRNSSLGELAIGTLTFHDHPAVRQWLGADPTRTCGRFGSLCCRREGSLNKQPPPLPGEPPYLSHLARPDASTRKRDRDENPSDGQR